MYEENIHHVTSAALYETELTTGSPQSLLCSLERFFQSVNTMAAVVMVPSKLVDIEEDSESDESSASSTCSSDSVMDQNLYQAFKMLVECKQDLMWADRDKSGVAAAELDEAKQFKHHLDGLNGLLAQFSKLADSLTDKYQNAPGIKDVERCDLFNC
jgi:hypothetical protein